jgi:hypothetical protein
MKLIGLFFMGCLMVLHSFAQQYEGVWEGKLSVNMGKVKSLSVRMELQEEDKTIAGVLYMRGFDGKTSFGCDYFVKGSTIQGRILLEQLMVIRSAAISKGDCGQMHQLILRPVKEDSTVTLTGNFEWKSEEQNKIFFSKTSNTVTPLGEEDISAYMEQRASLFDLSNLFLQPSERYNKKVLDTEIDSSNFVFEIANADSATIHDSVSVYFNGQIVAGPHFLSKPLLIRFTQIVESINTIVVVNESTVQRTLNIHTKITFGTQVIRRTIQPGFSRNSLFAFRKKLFP